MGSAHCFSIRLRNLATWIAVIICASLIAFKPITTRCEEKVTDKADKLIGKVGFDLGIPYGLPGVHLEIGHFNVSALVGAGLSGTWLVHKGICNLEDEYPIVFVLGGVVTLAPKQWALRPRATVFYTNESVYFQYRAEGPGARWKTFHKERFPGFCAVLELELHPQKLGLPAYRDNPNVTLVLGVGINEPSVGWDAIDELQGDICNRIKSEGRYTHH